MGVGLVAVPTRNQSIVTNVVITMEDVNTTAWIMMVAILASVTRATKSGQATSNYVTESLVLQAAGQLLAADTRHVVVFLKWILEQIALLHAIAVIESMDPPQVAAVMMESGILVQVPTVK